MVAIGIPVCRPLWKDWVRRLLPGGESHQTYTASDFSGQQRTIGGSEMFLSKGTDSKPGSKARKGSKGNKSLSSNILDADDIEMLEMQDTSRENPTSHGGNTPDSWSSYSHV